MGGQDYKKTSSDHCVFVQKNSDNNFIILLLYVDDMLIVGKNTSKIDELKKKLCKSFSMKDLGDAKQILGMRITRLGDERKIYLSQKNTPHAGYMKLSKKMCTTTREEKENMDKVPYSFIVGNLILLTQWVLKADFLKIQEKSIEKLRSGYSNECLCFGPSNQILKGYTDFDMAGDLDNRKSTTGY
uniref:Reverse transcriptase Ty1/copia-type domain-containing protein n=1 Tax=Solanum lycopersicum TaxID=4081 RepID=A0A3Q7ED08_SOLLC